MLDHADMEKAVRWAVHSAKQAAQQPTCTVFVIPGYQDHQHTAYFKWLEAEPSYCFKIASIQNKYIRYCKPADRHTGPPYTGCHKSKETIVLLVANQPAFQHLADTIDPDAYAADMYRAVRCTTEPLAVGGTHGTHTGALCCCGNHKDCSKPY